MKPGSESNPLKVAIVGAGPSGFYTAEALIRSDVHVEIDLIERLPCPYGLVRSGVAPDHPKLKNAIAVYDKIAQDNPQLHYVGNVSVGRDLSISELRSTHHAIVLTCGAETDRKLQIPGEDLAGSYTATEFVGWYNGHPDYRDRQFDLSHESAVVIGQGNVAADVSRILSKSVDELKSTDITQYALDALAQSNVRNVFILGRRGPAQAKFTSKELKEFGELQHCDPIVDPAELELNAASKTELAEKTNAGSKKVYDLFCQYAKLQPSGKPRRCHFQFLRSPVELIGKNHVEKIIIEHNILSGEPFKQSARGTGQRYELEAGIVFRSIGYRGLPMPDVPFDEGWGVYPNQQGRIMEGEIPAAQLYTAGWIKRGPSGIIGTNRACAVETVGTLLSDLEALEKYGATRVGHRALIELLDNKNVRHINFPQWKIIDAYEVEAGRKKQKPREKITSIEKMLDLV